ncbi:extracellular solute-binding protein [Meiothermus granaticius]|uniref:Maltose/maltodextrin-binding protein n=1 Tax=Meiothermus granaticius NBRC 107808 TaxID=1227551 RepID=A0A399FC63_9DEIN|nr:extracellular solute-binding protein [Meiothermus granaticius]RIH93818.1 Maltose/maltodextrin-binding protein [Meiothermus granaticius NBRC 107808]GEM86315.1 ABC transporter substrate-binding protein [Meiothermus granaticius NBRC 107808]
MKRWVVIGVLLSVLGGALAQTTVRLAGFGGDNTAVVSNLLKEVVNPALEKEGIKAVYEGIEGDYNASLLNALSAGTAADLFYVDVNVSEPIFASGKVEPLDKYFSKADIAPFISSLVQSFTIGGKLYGIPKDFNTLAVVYNKDLFDEAKVPYPNQTDTWDTFKAKLTKVQSALKDVAGLCVVADYARFGEFAYAAGWKPINAQGKTMLDANFKRAFTWYTSLVKDRAAKFAPDLGEGWTGGCLGAEKSAVAIEGAWIGGFLRDKAPNMNYGSTYIPLDPQTKKRGNFIFTVSWSLNAASKNKDAAIKVLKALTSPEAQNWVLNRGLALPSRKALSTSAVFQRPGKENELNRVVFNGSTQMGGVVLPYKFGKYNAADWQRPFNEAMQAVITGKKTVDQAIADAQNELNRLMK